MLATLLSLPDCCSFERLPLPSRYAADICPTCPARLLRGLHRQLEVRVPADDGQYRARREREAGTLSDHSYGNLHQTKDRSRDCI
jgi:hypothetical protein